MLYASLGSGEGPNSAAAASDKSIRWFLPAVLGLALVPQAEANQAAPKNGFIATAEGYVMEGER